MAVTASANPAPDPSPVGGGAVVTNSPMKEPRLGLSNPWDRRPAGLRRRTVLTSTNHGHSIGWTGANPRSPCPQQPGASGRGSQRSSGHWASRKPLCCDVALDLGNFRPGSLHGSLYKVLKLALPLLICEIGPGTLGGDRRLDAKPSREMGRNNKTHDDVCYPNNAGHLKWPDALRNL